jgi:hypothetical protein
VAKVEEVEAPSASDTADMPLWASTSLKAMQDFKLNVFLSPEVDLDLHLQVVSRSTHDHHRVVFFLS